MLSVVVQFRNLADITPLCLQSIQDTFESVEQKDDLEFIFVDDLSDSGTEVMPLLLRFRKAMPFQTRIIRFTKHQHYARACAHTFSLAQGDILFVSPDMILTPDCVQAMLQVASLDPSSGIVRATSNYVDCFPNHIVKPALPFRDLQDVYAFSHYIAGYFGDAFVEDPFLTGDVMLIKRDLIAKIGVMDPIYYGYFGDIDYGLRAQQAGFRLTCAKGAWLQHEGAGFYKHESTAKKIDFAEVHRKRMITVNDAYKLFRDKWDRSLPPEYPGTAQIDLEKLRRTPASFDLYQAPLTLSPEIGEFL